MFCVFYVILRGNPAIELEKVGEIDILIHKYFFKYLQAIYQST